MHSLKNVMALILNNKLSTSCVSCMSVLFKLLKKLFNLLNYMLALGLLLPYARKTNEMI